MEREKRIELLLTALATKNGIAIRFANLFQIRDPDFVPDVMQETASRILDSAVETFDPARGKPEWYVAAILYNVCIWQMDRFYRNPGLPSGFDISTDDWEPVWIASRREEIGDAETALGLLETEERELLVQWGSHAHRPRRKTMGEYTSTADVHIHRAKLRFLAKLLVVRNRKPRAA